MTIKVSDMLGCICLSCIHDLYFNDIDLTAIPANDALWLQNGFVGCIIFEKRTKKGVLFESRKSIMPPLDAERVQLLFSKYVLACA